MKVSLRQLQVFDAVATLGAVTRAAARLRMSQSAASSALADLEVILKRRLFARVQGHPLQLTDEGKRLHPIVRSVLTEIHDLEGYTTDATLRGQLVIGATAMIAETHLPRICVAFMELHPEVQVNLQVGPVAELFERLSRLELETALIELHPSTEGIELTKWRTDELVLVVSPEHPLANRPALQIRDLAGFRWCMREQASSTSAGLRYILSQQIGQLPVAFESTSNWAVRHAVIAGGGIGCLSRALVEFDLDNRRLVQLHVEGFRYTRALSLARPSNVSRGRLTAAFEAFLLDHESADLSS